MTSGYKSNWNKLVYFPIYSLSIPLELHHLLLFLCFHLVVELLWAFLVFPKVASLPLACYFFHFLLAHSRDQRFRCQIISFSSLEMGWNNHVNNFYCVFLVPQSLVPQSMLLAFDQLDAKRNGRRNHHTWKTK